MKITEEQFENYLLGILAELGYVYENGRPSNLPEGGFRLGRKDYREVVLLRERLAVLNPAAREG